MKWANWAAQYFLLEGDLEQAYFDSVDKHLT